MTPAPGMDRERRAGDYVLGVMDEAEALAFEAEIAQDPALAALVARWRERFRELDETAVPDQPSEMLWQQIERQLGPVPVSGRPERRGIIAGWWDSLAFWRFSGLAATAAAVLLAIGLAASLQRGVSPPRMVAVLIAESDGRPLAVVEIGERGASRLVALDAIPVPEGRALQVWTLPSVERGPVSIGLLDRPRSAVLDTASLPEPRPDQLFEITLEPETGSPTGRPTGPIIVKGFARPTL